MSNTEPSYTIFCFVPGTESTFPVDVGKTKTTAHLKRAIKTEKPNDLVSIDADRLTLHRAKIDEHLDNDREKRMGELGRLSQSLNECLSLDEVKGVSQYFDEGPPDGSKYYVIVVVPKGSTTSGVVRTVREEEALDTLEPLPKRQRTYTDITEELLTSWKNPMPISEVQNLRQYLQYPLSDREKIPISQDDFDRLCVPFSRRHESAAISARELGSLFRVSKDEQAMEAYEEFSCAVIKPTPRTGREDAYHVAYDLNISAIVEFILSDSASGRNTNHDTSLALQRPDYSLLVDNHCLLRGEEKAPDAAGDPNQELIDKIVRWTYGPLPYILGYHARGSVVTFVAIMNAPRRTEFLFSHDLCSRKARVANMVQLIRLSAAIEGMREVLDRRDRPEFMSFERAKRNVRMTIGGNVVMKEFMGNDATEHVNKLVAIYKLLDDKEVPNVNKLNNADFNAEYPRVFLSPVGHDVTPSSGEEVFSAVVCVLQALKVMHADPPVYHRDIRTPNIIKSFDGQRWFLIDLCDASTTPTKGVTHLSDSEHSPAVRADNHGPEVDIWGVGRYMRNLASLVSCGIAKPEAVEQMACRWMDAVTTTASSALEEIENKREFFVGSEA